jgi:hypothetical protein
VLPPTRGLAPKDADFAVENPLLYVIEAHERLVPEPLTALRHGFERSDLKVYDIAAPYGRRAVLFGANRWPTWSAR